MDPIKIIFFDIDGTLVDMNRKCISEKTVEALRRLRERGILLCIATGRSPVSLPKFEGVEFDAFLTFNGSYCFCKEGDIFSNPIPYADVMTLLRNAAGLGRPVALATKEKLTANGWEEDLAQYYAFAGLTLEPSEDFEECLREEVYQLMMGCREAAYPGYCRMCRVRRSLPGGIGRWISSLPAAVRAWASKRSWPITVWTDPRPWPSATETTTSKCSRPWAPASLWKTPPQD